MWTLEQEPGETAVAPEHFQDANDPEPGHWRQSPSTWAAAPVDQFLSAELRDTIEAAIDELPASQQSVITLRDLEGWSALETCNILQISESNQRVLLHRARARVRRAIERYVQAAEEAT
jgi:RNA polymerase sigma-70 factor (ECF subfamily)